jgi:hypothetical protein
MAKENKGKAEKVKKAPKEKAPKEKKHKHVKPAPLPGITTVELMTGFPEEAASCAFEAATGRLTLRIPPPLDGLTGPQGPQGPRGEAGKGIDYAKAPAGEGDFFLFVDEIGRLSYSAGGTVSLVSLAPGHKATFGDDEAE